MLLPFGWPHVRVAGTVSDKVSDKAMARPSAEKLSVPSVNKKAPMPVSSVDAEIAATEAQIAELEAETAALKTKLAEEKA